jgi:hypothetical protein
MKITALFGFVFLGPASLIAGNLAGFGFSERVFDLPPLSLRKSIEAGALRSPEPEERVLRAVPSPGLRRESPAAADRQPVPAMRVVPPDPRFDYALQVKLPDGSIDYKMRIKRVGPP